MENNHIVFKRESLYEKVWSVPMKRLAKEYGISDVALAKICKKLGVPRPPRGYWAKLQFKKKVHRPPLPDVSGTDLKEFVHHESQNTRSEIRIDPEKLENFKVKREIVVPNDLENAHRLVKEAKIVLEHAKQFDTGLLDKRNRACLEVNVSPACLDRALRIMDAVVKGIEGEGFAIAVERGTKISSYALIKGEKVCFAINEAYRRVDHVPTPREKVQKKARPFWDIKKYDYQPTGELSLKIEEYAGYGSRKKWSDSKTGRLEEKVGEFIGGTVLVAHLLKIEREKREEGKRKWEEERKLREEDEKRRREEEARLQKLEQHAALWVKSEQLRAFVQTVEKVVADMNMPESKRKGYEGWIAWARKHADQIDPIKQSFSRDRED